MKIYTKTGDKGDTGLLGGVRISKSHLVIEATGSLDETNSQIGLARSEGKLPKDIDQVLGLIQNDLFDLGSQVAACLGESNRPPEFPESRVGELETFIDQFDAELSPLECFVLPGGNQSASQIHVARSICRRAERDLVRVTGLDVKNSLSTELVYLNRLSDLLFVLGRLINVRAGVEETKWDVGRAGS
jgi:cob(I)alamin adenosyltransferase